MTTHYSRRAVLTGIIGTLSLGAFSIARGAEPRVAADEGVVIYGLPATLVIRSVEFRQLHSSVEFAGWPQVGGEAPQPSVVKAGSYYLYNYDTLGTGILHRPNKEPADLQGAFQVLPGAVTYIGEWWVTLQSVQLAARMDTIAKARDANPWLEHYPLFVALLGHDPARLPWDQVPKSH
jgi:hypothetical protein